MRKLGMGYVLSSTIMIHAAYIPENAREQVLAQTEQRFSACLSIIDTYMSAKTRREIYCSLYFDWFGSLLTSLVKPAALDAPVRTKEQQEEIKKWYPLYEYILKKSLKSNLKTGAQLAIAALDEIELCALKDTVVYSTYSYATSVNQHMFHPLNFAIKHSTPELVQLLLSSEYIKKYYMYKPDKDTSMPLFLAIQTNNIPALKALLSANIEVNCHDNYSATPLYYAVSQNNQEITDILLQAGATGQSSTTQSLSNKNEPYARLITLATERRYLPLLWTLSYWAAPEQYLQKMLKKYHKHKIKRKRPCILTPSKRKLRLYQQLTHALMLAKKYNNSNPSAANYIQELSCLDSSTNLAK